MRRHSDGAELFPHRCPARRTFCPNDGSTIQGPPHLHGLREILWFPPKLKETKGEKKKLFCFVRDLGKVQLEPACSFSSREMVLRPHVSAWSQGVRGPPGGNSCDVSPPVVPDGVPPLMSAPWRDLLQGYLVWCHPPTPAPSNLCDVSPTAVPTGRYLVWHRPPSPGSSCWGTSCDVSPTTTSEPPLLSQAIAG